MSSQLATLAGVVPPMITPLDDQGQLDLEASKRLVGSFLDAGVSGIFVLGTSGEGPWLTARQQQQLVNAVVEACANRVPVLAGALEPSTARCLESGARLRDVGADAIVFTTPYYFQTDSDAQLRHFDTLLSSISHPVMLYNIPSMTHNALSARTLRQLMGHTNLIGVKDSAGNWEDFLALLELRRERPDFLVLQGDERQSARSLLGGADGIVPGLANLMPTQFVQLLSAARAKQELEAMALQERLDRLWHIHGFGYWLLGLKHAASLLGFGSGATAGSLGELDLEAKRAIRRLLEETSAVLEV